MSVFTKRTRTISQHPCKMDLWLRCDGCGKEELVYENQTDALLVHDFIRENGWKTTKRGNLWINICPDCIAALRQKKREEWLKTL